MTAEEKRTFLQCLFTVAWTDGEIQERENAILATLFNNVELPQEDRRAVEKWFDAPPPEPDWFIAASTPDLRHALVEQVMLVAGADGNVDLGEMGLVERLRSKLGMEEEEFQKIVAKVEKILAS